MTQKSEIKNDKVIFHTKDKILKKMEIYEAHHTTKNIYKYFKRKKKKMKLLDQNKKAMRDEKNVKPK